MQYTIHTSKTQTRKVRRVRIENPDRTRSSAAKQRSMQRRAQRQTKGGEFRMNNSRRIGRLIVVVIDGRTYVIGRVR